MDNSTSKEKKPKSLESDRFPERLREVVGDQSIRGFARECGFSDTVLRQYLNGQSEPTRPALLAIARTAQVSLEWLASGEASSRGSNDSLDEKYTYKRPLAFETEWLASQFSKSFDHLLLTTVKDGSMEPTLAEGDLILVDTTDRDLEAIEHGIYLVKLEDRILLKRLQYLPGKTIRLLSDNPAYEAFSLHLSERRSLLNIMGHVVWYSHKF
ncbi:MAG: S24 family peptidase [Cyanobacteria bacterium P01_A01_bin.3]